jgi:hypothetical protein
MSSLPLEPPKRYDLHHFEILVPFPSIIHAFRDERVSKVFDVFLTYNRTVRISILGCGIYNFKVS